MQNDKIRILKREVLSDDRYILSKITYESLANDGSRQIQTREAYDRGNGSTILLYNRSAGKVILTKQFRLPTFINGNETGMLIEACAGLLDRDNPEDCVIKEAKEETGYKIAKVEKIFEAYMSPGSVTEILYFFIAEYSYDMKISEGGGLEHEQENIEVLELDFEIACNMIKSGEIKDGKTIILLQYAKINNLL